MAAIYILYNILTTYQALKNASSLGGDPSRFFTLGTSAGAGLALAVANQFAKTAPEAGKNPVRGIVAMGPTAVHPDNIPAEYESLHKSYKENAVDVPVIDKASMDEFYRAQDADPTDSDTFTALSPHLAKFPATYIVTTATDPVRDDGVVVEAALKKAG